MVIHVLRLVIQTAKPVQQQVMLQHVLHVQLLINTLMLIMHVKLVRQAVLLVQEQVLQLAHHVDQINTIMQQHIHALLLVLLNIVLQWPLQLLAVFALQLTLYYLIKLLAF